MTTNVPATVIPPARENVPVLGAICSVTVPLSVPLAGVAVTQLSEFWTVQEQPEPVWTPTVVVPPSFVMSMSVGATVNEQAAAPCVTATVRPATVSVPVRGVVVGLASTVKLNQAVPVPDPPVGMVIHVTSLEADQLQPVVVLTSALLADPAPPIVTVAGVTL